MLKPASASRRQSRRELGVVPPEDLLSRRCLTALDSGSMLRMQGNLRVTEMLGVEADRALRTPEGLQVVGALEASLRVPPEAILVTLEDARARQRVALEVSLAHEIRRALRLETGPIDKLAPRVGRPRLGIPGAVTPIQARDDGAGLTPQRRDLVVSGDGGIHVIHHPARQDAHPAARSPSAGIRPCRMIAVGVPQPVSDLVLLEPERREELVSFHRNELELEERLLVRHVPKEHVEREARERRPLEGLDILRLAALRA